MYWLCEFQRRINIITNPPCAAAGINNLPPFAGRFAGPYPGGRSVGVLRMEKLLL